MNDSDLDYQDSSSYELKENVNKWKCIFNPLYKILFKYPSRLMRVILQFGDFYFLFQILSFTIQYFLILMTATARLSKWRIVLLFICIIIFSFLFTNVLSIPLWELIQFRWLNNINPVQTIFDIFQKKKSKKALNIWDIVLSIIIGAFFWSYLVFAFLGYQIFEIENYIILFFIPLFKFTAIYLCYFIRAIQSIFRFELFNYNNLEEKLSQTEFLDPFVLTMMEPKVEVITLIICLIIDLKVDFLQYDNPFLNKIGSFVSNYSCLFLGFDTIFQLIFILIKEIGIVFGLAYLIWIKVHFKIDGINIVIPLLIWFYNSVLGMAINMPIWITDICERWDSTKRIICATSGIDAKLRRNYKFKGFKYINSICTFLIPLLVIVFLVFRFSQDTNSFEPINQQTLWNGNISHIYDHIPYSKRQVRSPMCGIGIYHLNLVQIGAIAAASYYNNNNLTLKYLRNSFFRDDNLKITRLTHELDKDDYAVLLRADIDVRDSSRNLTVFAVRGSTTSVDWWLDFEIFISSALISVARWIPVLQNYESFGSKIIGHFMNCPLTQLYKATLTYNYTEPMFKVIQEFMNNSENEFRTILFTGHSLGGGLSKILANKFGLQSVAFSGPGISPIEDKFKKDDYDIYFKSKFIDIIPDNDFVPRFEISGGTKYRVLCEQNGGECHSILRTICQLGVSCGLEYYTGDFCRGRYNVEQYEDMISLSHGHKKYY